MRTKKMSKKTLNTDLIIESFLGFLTLSILSVMLLMLLILGILPINNYHYATGWVEYKNQYKIVSQNEGIITRVFAENKSTVIKGDSILQYRSEKEEREIGELKVKINFLNNELQTLQLLFHTGAVNKPEINKKILEIEEIKTRIQNLEKNVVTTPVDGIMIFKVLPDFIKGSYIEKGQELAFVCLNEEKHIHISFPNNYADRFKIGRKVVFKYKDPESFKIQKMKGSIYKIFIDEKQKTIEIFCNVNDGIKSLSQFQHFTMVDAAIIINSTSIIQDMLGLDLFPYLKKIMEQQTLYTKVVEIYEKFIYKNSR